MLFNLERIGSVVREIVGRTSLFSLMFEICSRRYIVIVHPMKSRSWCTMGNTKKIIAGVWVVAVLLSCPLVQIMVSSYTIERFLQINLKLL